jgi:hypothetical protein
VEVGVRAAVGTGAAVAEGEDRGILLEVAETGIEVAAVGGSMGEGRGPTAARGWQAVTSSRANKKTNLFPFIVNTISPGIAILGGY